MIFSHVLYQLSYPGIAAASDHKDRRAIGSAPMAKARRLGKKESVLLIGIDRRWRSGKGVSVVQPLQEVAVAAVCRAEGRVLLYAGFAADRAFLGWPVHKSVSWA
jgi:hypothetical protein